MAALIIKFALLVGCIACVGAQQQQNTLSWRQASDPRALCNDYTRAGFFLNLNPNSKKWIIFLESGSLCYSNDTCNRRFFNEKIRREENSDNPGVSADFPYGKFDTLKASNDNLARNLSYAEFVSPLMTSMECLQSRFDGEFRVNGRDILDSNETNNPDFFDHNHVIIPYCSSDLWLGEEILNSIECNCSDLKCFGYQADSPNLQFTFRGKLIFQTIFNQLQNEHGMDIAVEVVIAGSSAGGLGAINHAQWVRDQLLPETRLLILLDSSWFINFQDSIYRIFDGTMNSMQSLSSTDTKRLLRIISSNPSCSDLSLGYPCCISAHCIMTRYNSTGQLAYYPTNQRTFAILSLYDLFLLAPALAGQDNFVSSSSDSPDGNDEDDDNLTGSLINFLRVIGEYGGEMNATVSLSYNELPFLSYYSAQCFQHVYLATSTLWEGTDPILSSVTEQTSDLTSFTHVIQSGRWSINKLSSHNSTTKLTIQEAISVWYNANNEMRFTDACQGPYCNENCPDEFVLIGITSNNWPKWAKLLLIAITLVIPISCIIMKGLFVIWLFILERKQLAYLNSLHDMETGENSKLELLECEDKDKVSVSCLDLKYSITYKITKKIKDETMDETNIVALHDIQQDLVLDEEEEKQEHRKSRFERVKQTLRRRTHNHDHKHNSLKHTDHMETIEEDESDKSSEHGGESDKDDDSDDDSFVQCFQEWTTKDILKGISLYFNPKSIIGIMGPSGCGKTTFLDILTGRRRSGKFEGNIFINGFPLDEMREWYVSNTGYVLQLATPYYAELTVRDNLTLAAQIMLGKNVTMKDKFRRVELVMQVTGLSKLADTIVGGEVGPGLSGGQKRRLAVALQLLKLPSVVYLDEPTSGLDATSSMELLYHLDLLAKSGRTVILTIHQPRMEIFHMFDRLVLLSDGRVAYHGAPEKAYEVFVSALLRKKMNYSSLTEQNPADVIMDMLGNPKLRKSILEYYETLDEPKNVRKAVEEGINKQETTRGLLRMALFGSKSFTKSSSSTFVRLAALEARGSKRLTLGQIAFLPAMFFLLAFILGTVYFQRKNPYLIVPAMAVFSCASGLYVFPAIELYYSPAIRLFGYEKANGVGKARDLVAQGFIRYITIAFFPVLVSTSLIYLLLVKYTAYSFVVYIQVLVVNFSLNLTWTALLTALIMTFPKSAFRISSVVASIAGFASGFFIPIGNIHWGYRWIAYINPNYYALSSVIFFVLEDFDLCEGTQFECFFGSGAYILRMFFFDKINPYVHLVVLLLFTLFYLSLAVLANWVHNTHIKGVFKRFKHALCTKKDTTKESALRAHISTTSILNGPRKPLSENSGWKRLKEALAREGSLKKLLGDKADESIRERSFSFLSGNESHQVWKPKFNFSDIVTEMKKQAEEEKSETVFLSPLQEEEEEEKQKVKENTPTVKSIIRKRKKTLMNRVNFAWKVLQEEQHSTDVPEAHETREKSSDRWKVAAKKAAHSAQEKKQTDFSLIVSSLLNKQPNRN